MQVKCPNLGDGISSATVLSILVSVGDIIKAEDTIAELETDKAVAPIPTTQGGTVKKILIQIGDTVKTGSPILELETAGDAEPAVAAAPVIKETPSVPTPEAKLSAPIQNSIKLVTPQVSYEAVQGEEAPTSPSIKIAANRFGIDLKRVQGTGSGGRITEEDVQNYITYIQSQAFNPQRPIESAPSQSQEQVPVIVQKKTGPEALDIDFSKWGEIRVEPASSLRRKISEKLRNTWNTAPHVTQFDDADITDLMEIRKHYKDMYAEHNAPLTVTILAIKALVNALKAFPLFNASFDESTGTIIYKDYYNIGFAVDTEKGLLVPVIKNVDQKSLLELAQEVALLSEKSKNRTIGVQDLQGGTFTLSNLGGLGVGHFTPLINHPEVAILGMGKGSYRVILTDQKKARSRLILPLALSYDHRLIDGADGARFMRKVIDELENFDVQLLELSDEETTEIDYSPEEALIDE